MVAKSCIKSPVDSLPRPCGLRLRLDEPSAWLWVPLVRLGECGRWSVSIGAEENKVARLIFRLILYL